MEIRRYEIIHDITIELPDGPWSSPPTTPIATPPAWDNGARKEGAMEIVKQMSFALWAVLGFIGLVLVLDAAAQPVHRAINQTFCSAR